MLRNLMVLSFCILLCTAMWLFSGCGGGGVLISVEINPAGPVLLTANQSHTYVATVNGSANQAVQWSADGGTITPAGVYTAPAIAGSYHVTAVAVADVTKHATVTVVVTSVDVTPGGPVSLTINQSQAFTATVTGYANQAVQWSADSGSITNGGVYTAPAIAGTYHVTAVADANANMHKTVTVVVQTADSNVLIQ